MIPQRGDRVKVTGIMPDDPCPMEIGVGGTVKHVGEKIGGITQITVDWDNGRGLSLLDCDPFVVTSRSLQYDENEGA